MFKQVIVLLAACCLQVPGYCQTNPQDVNILMGQEVKASKRATLEDIVGYDSKGYYILKRDKDDLLLEYYDKQLQLQRSQVLDLKAGGKEKQYENIIQLNNKLYLFSSLNDQKNKKNCLYAQTIDKGTLQPNSDSKSVAQIEYDRKKNNGNFYFRLSPDSSKVLIFSNLPYEKGEPERYNFSVLDKTIQPLWQKNVTLPYNDELFEVEREKIDNRGNVYLLGLVYREKAKKKRHGKPNYEYHILSYTAGGSVSNEYTVDLRDKFITDMQIAMRQNGDIACGGFYSEKGTFSIKGTFFITLDAGSKRKKKENLKEFTKDFLSEFMSEKKAEKGKELYEYDLDRLILREDGGAILVAEQYFVNVVTTYAGTGAARTPVTTYYYNYNHLVVINVNPDGSIQWANKIPKRQVTVNDGGFFSSYTFSMVKDKMYFIFNDNPKNLDNSSEDKLYNFALKGGVVVLVEMDKKGNMKKQALFNAKEAEVITRPKVCEQVSGNEVVIFGQKRKTHKFAKLTFI